MAIIFKKKATTADPIPAKPTLSVREEEDLAAVGLAPAPTKAQMSCSPALHPEQFPTRQKGGAVYSEGQRARITNPFYTWIKAWQPGDLVTVLKYHPPVPEARGDRAYGLVIARLDTVREKGKTEAYFHAWELEPVEGKA